VSIALTVGFGRRQFALPFPLRPFLQVVAGAAFMAAVVYPIRGYRGGFALTGQVVAGAAAYGAALVAMNFLGARDRVNAQVRSALDHRRAPKDLPRPQASAALEGAA
jgi:hypothetical protein